MNRYDVPAAQEAARLGVHRTTLIEAIQAGRCAGEERDGWWYTSTDAAAAWYRDHYRHKKALYSTAAGKAWTEKEAGTLRDMLTAGSPMTDIAAALKRSVGSVKVKISKLRKSDATALPPATEVKALHKKLEMVKEAQALLDAEAVANPDPYQQRRAEEREGRLRLHVHPTVKAALGRAAKRAGLTLAIFVTRAGLAAAADPEVLERGRIEAEKIGK